MRNIFLFGLLFLMFSNSFSAEIVDNISREEKKFGDWTLFCEQDVMLDKTDCKVFSTFYNNLASIYIQPNNKIANQVVIIIPQAVENSSVVIRIDRNNLLNSDIVDKKNRFGVIPFPPSKQKLMFSQIKSGQNLYIRFTVRDPRAAGGMKEITAKISLAEFSKLLVYYDMKMNVSK